MGLPNLLNIPKDANEMNSWSWSHKDSHVRIVEAIQAQKGIALQQYLIDPVNENDIPTWLERHQAFHTDMNGALGTQGSDLESVDWKDEKQRDAWFYSQYEEHFTAHSILKI